MKPLASTIIVPFAFISVHSEAHVRWFIDAAVVPDVPFVLNWPLALSALLITLYVSGILLTNQFLSTASKNSVLNTLKTDWSLPAYLEWYALFGMLNIVLVVNLMLGEYLAPNLILHPSLIPLGIFIQATVLVLLPFSPAIVGVALIIVAFLNIAFFGAAIALDYFFEFFGVGMAFIFVGPYVSRFDRRVMGGFNPNKYNWENLAILSLRLGLGLQLLELAIHNKFIGSGYALLFVEQHSYYNFIQLLGYSQFGHTDFVYFVGFFEAVLGILLCAGIAMRLVSITLGFVFITTAVVSGVEELVGHLPIMGTLLILILKGQSSVQLSPFKHFFTSLKITQ